MFTAMMTIFSVEEFTTDLLLEAQVQEWNVICCPHYSLDFFASEMPVLQRRQSLYPCHPDSFLIISKELGHRIMPQETQTAAPFV